MHHLICGVNMYGNFFPQIRNLQDNKNSDTFSAVSTMDTLSLKFSPVVGQEQTLIQNEVSAHFP